MNEIITISGVSCYEKDGTAYLSLEAVARGLGFTKTDVKVSETGFRKEYIRIDWPRVERYLAELGFSPEVGKDSFIPENIFYRLAMKAKNEAAEKFQAKIADEVIPSIRKYGGYIAGQDELSDSELLAKALLVAQRKLEERDKKIEADRPKVLFADAVSASDSTILIGELAKLISQHGVKTGQRRLFQWMRDNGYLIRREGTDYNMPTQRSMELGLFSIKETAVNCPDGHIRVTKTVRVTGKGQQYFINKFLNK